MAFSLRKYLSTPGLLAAIRAQFTKICDPRNITKPTFITLVDHLMAGLAVFGLKCASLLDYDKNRFDTTVAQNLKNLYLVEKPPCDTYLRERLDEVDPSSLRSAFKKVFALFQRGKGLEKFEYLNGHVLISLDGTGLFASGKISCPHCCKKTHSNGECTYYHQMLGASVVHPDLKNVIPLFPEIISNQDGSSKNDCERNACKRFIENFRREHPHLKAILIADGLSSNAPNINLIEKHGLRYILGAKPGDHKFLFEQLEQDNAAKYYETTTDDGCYHQFYFLNAVSLNKANLETRVNVLQYRQTDKKGKERNFSWVTNIQITKNNVFQIMRGGRARWKIENETFNTLKNLGYNLEHNYGHGKKNLSTIFCLLMMLAFLIDQIQEMCCALFQRCREFKRTYRNLWAAMQHLFHYVVFMDWESFYSVILKEKRLDTS